MRSKKRQLNQDDAIVIVVVKEKPYEVGIDPYNKLIDRVSSDNRMVVTLK